MTRLACRLAAALLLLPIRLRAQTPADSAPATLPVWSDSTRLPSDTLKLAGSFVRGTLPGGLLFHGVVRAVRGDTLVLREADATGAPRLVAASSLRRLEVRRTGKSAETNMMIFGVLGAAGGALVYLNWCDKHSAECQRERERLQCGCDEADSQWDTASFLIGTGALLGIGIGYILTPPSWRRVGISVGGSIAPAPDGSLSASFGARVPLARFGARR